jgi:hypothetical protein
MRPTTVRANLASAFNQHYRTTHIGVATRHPELPKYKSERLALMKGAWEPDDSIRADDCPGFLFDFLTGQPLCDKPCRGDASIGMEVRKRKQATLLYALLKKFGKAHRLAGVQREDQELVPTIRLGRNPLPRNATYDVICSTDNANAMAGLCEGFDDSTRIIRGLRLVFGAKVVPGASLKDIRDGIARERELSAIELKTHSANTAAEIEVFRSVGANSNIKQLSVAGQLAEGHRLGVSIALSNASLENVEIRADEASCLRMLDWAAAGAIAAAAAAADGRKNLLVEIRSVNGAAARVKAKALVNWNAAVVRLAESGTTKCLLLPGDIEQDLTDETRQALAGKMDVLAI